LIQEKHKTAHYVLSKFEFNKPKNLPEISASKPKSVLILGSGGLSIGQAGEFGISFLTVYALDL
jgi:hypothetical protein